MPPPAAPSVEHRALADFHELLRAACEDRPPTRPQSVLYQSCRASLMGGRLKAVLPGFVRQCMSIERFREFIHLYDHDPHLRIRFVDGALEESWAKVGRARLARPAPSIAEPQAPSVEPVVAPPARPPAVIDDGDGFMDDPEDPEDPASPEPPVATAGAVFFADPGANRMRGTH